MTTEPARVDGQESFQLALPFFTGEVSDLARLVAERKLPTDEVAVSAVTQQFSGYLERRGEIDLEATGEFLVVAARLLLLKSSYLLATPSVDTDAERPERVLPSWLERDALAGLAAELQEAGAGESLPALRSPVEFERRIEPRSARVMARVWEEIARRREREAVPVSVPAFVRLEAAVSGLIRRLSATARISFRGLVQGRSTVDTVIQFVAVLELIRSRQAVARQDTLFGDITIEHAERAREADTRAG